MAVYQQPLEAPQWPYTVAPSAPASSGPSVPSVDVFVANMWRDDPSLCASIRRDFNLSTIFQPGIISYYGDHFLRLAASQIAMQNQATEIANVRSALSEKEKMLEVGNNITKDLRTMLICQQTELKDIRDLHVAKELHMMLVSQQSELQNIKDLIQRGPQSLTHSGPTETTAILPSASSSHSSHPPLKSRSPFTPILPAARIDASTEKFYRRSAALSPLKVNSLPDIGDTTYEGHGFGHAETYGPSFNYDIEERRLSINHESHGRPESPVISTSAIFVPPSRISTPTVQFGSTKQMPPVSDHDAREVPSGNLDDRLPNSIAPSNTKPPAIRILKKDEVSGTVSPALKNTEVENVEEKPNPTTSAVKPATYAAAVLSAPTTPSVTAPASPAKPGAVSTPDLGFPLQPLPKPTAEQIQFQQQSPIQESSDVRNQQGEIKSNSVNNRGRGRGN